MARVAAAHPPGRGARRDHGGAARRRPRRGRDRATAVHRVWRAHPRVGPQRPDAGAAADRVQVRAAALQIAAGPGLGRRPRPDRARARDQPREPVRAPPPDRPRGPAVTGMSRVLFVCLHNAGRSQMSQALFEKLAGDNHMAQSAGTEPGDRVHPNVVAVMREVGVDLESRKPRKLTDELARWPDVVITMGCGDACPVIPAKRYIDWELPDPSGLPVQDVRAIRDDIASRVEALVKDLDRTAIRR